MISMTKHIPVCKNTTGNHGQDAEEAPASKEETEKVGKPTGKEPDTQNVWDIYKNCNGRESGGRNSTKYTGASPTMPVNRET